MKVKTENVIAMSFFQAIMVILPLYVENRYFNIVEAKAHILTLIFAVAWISVIILFVFTKDCGILSEKLNGLDISVLSAGTVALISCAFSDSFRTAFFGSSGWGIGGFILISFSMFYMLLSRNAMTTYKSWLPAFVTVCVIAFFTVAHSASIDVLPFHSGMTGSSFAGFKSTLGNVNAHVGYSCLLAPVALIAFINEKDKTRVAAEFVFVLALLCEIAFACTDGIFIGLGACAFLAIPHICGSTQRMRRTCLALAAYGVLLLLSCKLGCFLQSNIKSDDISSAFHSLKFSLIIIAAGAAGYLLLWKRPDALNGKRASKCCVIILEFLLLAVVTYYIRDLVLNFSDKWGSGRGILWRASIESFSQLPPGRKLIGIGPEMQQKLLISAAHKRVYVCHSEPVQILLTMGIAGLISWLAIYGFAIYNMLRQRIWETEKVMYALPIVAYMGQSLIYSAVATNLGIFCVMLALYRNKCYNLNMKCSNQKGKRAGKK